MFNEGDILYFNPFYFLSGATPKNKYAIIIKVIGDRIIASLPTRTNRVPNYMSIQQGCLNHVTGCFNCYHFPHDVIIANDGFSFPIDTYIYGDEVAEYSLSHWESSYLPGVDFNLVGKLSELEYKAIIECLKISTSIKNKIRKLL